MDPYRDGLTWKVVDYRVQDPKSGVHRSKM